MALMTKRVQTLPRRPMSCLCRNRLLHRKNGFIILYPGELEWRREAKARAEGLELPVSSEQELRRAEEMTAAI